MMEKNVSQEEVTKEVKSILDELGHNQNLKSIRFFAFFLIKVFKALYNKVYINEDGVQRVRVPLQYN